MPGLQKQKKRGFVMTGGGAKGLYEAGVINAFHITGMDFDVVTGSSIGAMNAIVYAEYLRRKHCLPEEVRASPQRVIDELDPFVRAYHYAWLRLEILNLIDDSESGPLGRLKADLERSSLDLPLLARLAWWSTTPESGNPTIPWGDLVRLAKELVERVGLRRAIGILAKISEGGNRAEPILAAYLERMGLRSSLVQAGSPQENGIRDTFTRTELVLQPHHLAESYRPRDGEDGPRAPLLDAHLTLDDYRRAGVEVRLTRANYRTGRLETSACYSPEAFVSYMKSQAWRLDEAPQETPPLGSHRIQVPGNPHAIGAALASGRFPGVFAPFAIERIYDLSQPENALLGRILEHWLDDPLVEEQLTAANARLGPEESSRAPEWDELYARWRSSERLRRFFPRRADVYIDGGTIDNTPSNSAVDAVREWITQNGASRREVELDLYVVFLHPEPSLTMEEAQDPALYQVVGRTFRIQSAAKLSSDAAVVGAINGYGRRGEMLGDTLQSLLLSLAPLLETLAPEQRAALEERVYQQVRERGVIGFRGRSSKGILARMEDWTGDMLRRGLPLQVNEVKIYPDEMPMDTLQFTQRLGYRKANAIRMIVMGCYNTLWALRGTLEARRDPDTHDAQALALVRRWMGDGDWPKTADALDLLREDWRCRRVECVFHKEHCPHGEKRTYPPGPLPLKEGGDKR